MLTPVGNTASGTWRERESHRAFMAELHQQEEAARVKAEAPIRKLEQDLQASANALVQMEAANLLLIPDESPEGKKLMAYCDRITEPMYKFTFDDWSLLAGAGIKDAVTLWTLERVALPDADELTKCKAYLWANRLSPGDGNSWVSALARLTGFCLRMRPVPVPEAEPVAEVQPEPPPYGSREREIYDRIQYQRELVAEMSPTFRESVFSIQESSGLSMDSVCQKQLFAKFAEGRKPLSIENVRAAAISLWGAEKVGLLPEEKEHYKFAADEELTSDQFVQKYSLGNPRGSNQSDARLSTSTAVSAFRAGGAK